MAKRKKLESKQEPPPDAKLKCVRRVLYRGKLYGFDNFVSLMHLAWPKAKTPFDVWKLVELLGAEWVLPHPSRPLIECSFEQLMI